MIHHTIQTGGGYVAPTKEYTNLAHDLSDQSKDDGMMYKHHPYDLMGDVSTHFSG